MKGLVLTTLLRQANDTVSFLTAVWKAVQSACSNTGTNPDTDNAFESLSNLLRGYGNQGFALASIEGHVTVPHPVRDTSIDFMQPRTGQTER
jgi:hypothetical protein